MMKRSFVVIALAVAVILLVSSRGLRAEVKAGDVIDTTNWEKITDVAPESVILWVKNGDVKLKIADLEFEPNWDPEFLQASEKNDGKYALDSEGGLVEVAIGRRPDYVFGFPFPKIDPSDPQAATKIMWNRWQTILKAGTALEIMKNNLIGERGLEREIHISAYELYMDGRRGGKPDNPDKTEIKELIDVEGPAALAGTKLLTWRYQSNQPDSVWTYAPVFRRTRQLTAANRSDGLFGGDTAQDDAYLYYGKIQSQTWKLLREQDIVVPMSNTKENKLIREGPVAGDHSYHIDPDDPVVQFAYDRPTEGYAPWQPVNYKTVLRPVYVIEGNNKDPGYNYGRQLLYVDRENFCIYWKVIYTKAGEYWKTAVSDMLPASNEDGTRKYLVQSQNTTIDDRLRHASAAFAFPGKWYFHTERTYPSLMDVSNLARTGK